MSDFDKQIEIEEFLLGKNMDQIKKKFAACFLHLSPKGSAFLDSKIDDLTNYFSTFVVEESKVNEIIDEEIADKKNYYSN